ncbi:MAG: hypothetical protein K8T20_16980, partial [Planctomycetes bacterium]|nr:hypothetical protein [Planctomycetota bacterium]
SWYKSRLADLRSNSEGAKMSSVLDAREQDYIALVKGGILNEVRPLDVMITYERGGLTISGDTAELVGIQYTKPATSGMVIDQRKIPLVSRRHAVTMHLVNDKWLITGFEETEMK